MTFSVERKEDMSVEGFLRLHIQDDGDVCLTIGQGSDDFGCNTDGIVRQFASIEFCSTGAGGGASPETIKCLRKLAVAMAMDNKDSGKSHRNGRFLGEEILKEQPCPPQ